MKKSFVLIICISLLLCGCSAKKEHVQSVDNNIVIMENDDETLNDIMEGQTNKEDNNKLEDKKEVEKNNQDTNKSSKNDVYESFLQGEIKVAFMPNRKAIPLSDSGYIIEGTFDEICKKLKEKWLKEQDGYEPVNIKVEYKYIKSTDNQKLLVVRISDTNDINDRVYNFLLGEFDSELRIICGDISWGRNSLEFHDGGIIINGGSSGAGSSTSKMWFIDKKGEVYSIIRSDFVGINLESGEIDIVTGGSRDGIYLNEYIVGNQKYYKIEIDEHRFGENLEISKNDVEEIIRSEKADGKIVDENEIEKIIKNEYSKYGIEDFVNKINLMTYEEIENSWNELNNENIKNANKINPNKYEQFDTVFYDIRDVAKYYKNCDEIKDEFSFEFDLDNDKIKEKISIEYKDEEYIFKVNNVIFETNPHNFVKFCILDLNEHDKNFEIVITDNGPSDDPAYVIYFKTENEIKELHRGEAWNLEIDQDGKIIERTENGEITTNLPKIFRAYLEFKDGTINEYYLDIDYDYINSLAPYGFFTATSGYFTTDMESKFENSLQISDENTISFKLIDYYSDVYCVELIDGQIGYIFQGQHYLYD